MDEVGIDSDGICVSERGPGELPTARSDLGMLKTGQASKDKNCQVTGWGVLADSPCCWGPSAWGRYHSSVRRVFHGDPIADPPPGSLLSQAPVAGQGGQHRAYPQPSYVPALGQGERGELGVRPWLIRCNE